MKRDDANLEKPELNDLECFISRQYKHRKEGGGKDPGHGDSSSDDDTQNILSFSKQTRLP